MPNVVLCDEWVGSISNEMFSDPVIWAIAAEIGTGIVRSQHVTLMACSIQSLAAALTETFSKVLEVYIDFLHQLTHSRNRQVYDLLATAHIVLHEDWLPDSPEQIEFTDALLSSPAHVIKYAIALAHQQIIPMSPPLMAFFYQYLLRSPRLSHSADTEICLLWVTTDDKLANIILHPVQPFYNLQRTFVLLRNGHYCHVPAHSVKDMIPTSLPWCTPDVYDHSSTIGLGLFSCCKPAKDKQLIETRLVTHSPAVQQPSPTPQESMLWLPGLQISRPGGLHLPGMLWARQTQSRPHLLLGVKQVLQARPHLKRYADEPQPDSLSTQVKPRARCKYSINNALMAASIESEIKAITDRGPAILTTKEEETHWRYWCAYTAALETNSTRNNTAANSGADPEGHQNEINILRYAPIWIAQNCMAGRKTTNNGMATKRPTPHSALQVINSVMRIHKRRGITMARVSWRPILDGMCRQYTQEYGVSALQPKHHEPFTRDEVTKLTDPPPGIAITSTLNSDNSIKFKSFRAAMCLSSETGDRKADLALNPGVPFTIDRMTRSCLSYIIKGKHVHNPSRQELLSMAPGDLAVVTSASSKNDQFGMRWSCAPRYLPYGSYVNSSCRALVEYELAHPCAAALRNQVPLLSTDSLHTPWQSHDLSNSLKGLQHVLHLDTSKSWHSFRVYLASALLASKHDDPTIQAMVHWKTLESSRTYARIEPAQYAHSLILASQAQLTSVQSRNLPDIDLTRQLRNLQLETNSTVPNNLCDAARSPATATATPRAKNHSQGHIQDDIWEVEQVLEQRLSPRGHIEYFIKWKGWPDSHNSWEPESHLR